MQPFRLRKHTGNPVLSPNPRNAWESMQVCNPGAWYENGKVWMLYRAAGELTDYTIRLGLAVSTDGFRFTRVSPRPVLGPGSDYDGGGVEDARIVKFGDTYYITYATRRFPPAKFWLRRETLRIPPKASPAVRGNLSVSCLATTKDFRTFRKLGPITRSDVDDRDVILFPEKIKGRYVRLHRPIAPRVKRPPSIWLEWSNDLIHWRGDTFIAGPDPAHEFEEAKVGGSTPPLRTPRGWLVIYHGVSRWNVYRTGVMLLDGDNPAKIVARCPHHIMQPEAPHELEGVVWNVVFPTGNVVINGTLFIYYGCADKYIGVATADLDELTEYVWKFRR
jgi:predicted GH43/DUF377 family glycosyl hydrolase